MVSAVSPNLILHNANIVTLDPARPRAQALSVKGERIVALGDDKTILGTAGSNTVVQDARGLTVLPGFNDNHLHSLGMGLFFRHPNLFGKSADQIVEALKQHYAGSKPGQRLIGYAWDYSSCPNPNKALLDQAFPHNPVVLRQYSGHAQWLNTRALMELLDAAAKQGKAGTGAIVRDAQGEPTGIVLGTVVHSSHRRDLLKRALTPGLHWDLLHAALDRFRKAGITSVQDNTWQPFTIWLLHLLRWLGRLTARFSCWSFGQYPLLARGMHLSPYHPLWIRRGPEKYIVDGAFSPHTAWMLASYENEPGNTGRSVIQPQALEAIVRRGAKRRRQLAFHTIGDGAAKAVLDAIETVSRELPVVTQLRIRMEHVQIIDPVDAAVFRKIDELNSCTARGEFPGYSLPSPPHAVVSVDVRIEDDERLPPVPLHPV